MPSFYQKLRTIQRKNKSLLCVGLDPDINRIPRYLLASRNPVFEFNKRIIEATADLVCAYKLNLAFYESLGRNGWETLHRTLAEIPGPIVTIGDAKRGDLGNSAEMYARALFDIHKFTSCTVSPYMGEDSLRPFLKRADRGVFVLAVTSNPGARDFQYLPVHGKPLYEHVIRRVRNWNSAKNCGLVVGATRPRELNRVRAITPEMPLLIPGVGAQGGDLRLAVRYGCDAMGEMAVINASRSIIFASRGKDFAAEARKAALAMRDEMNKYREEFF